VLRLLPTSHHRSNLSILRHSVQDTILRSPRLQCYQQCRQCRRAHLPRWPAFLASRHKSLAYPSVQTRKAQISFTNTSLWVSTIGCHRWKQSTGHMSSIIQVLCRRTQRQQQWGGRGVRGTFQKTARTLFIAGLLFLSWASV
jgi:hypothetical protein